MRHAKMSLSMTLESWRTVLASLRRAVRHKFIPDGWRMSEYAMTKVRAEECVARIEAEVGRVSPAWEPPVEVELEVFDWSLLVGELARLIRQRVNPTIGDDYDVYRLIHEALGRNKAYSRLHQIESEMEATRRRIERREKQQREDEAALRVLRQKQADIAYNGVPDRDESTGDPTADRLIAAVRNTRAVEVSGGTPASDPVSVAYEIGGEG